MSEHVTLRGFVGKDPESRLFDDGTMVARFRLATTARRFDPATGSWHDGPTNWYTVRCFRTLAMHVMASVRCGHPVVVTGKLGINEWQSDNGPRTVVQVDAVAVGHDLAFGTANFSRAGGRSARGEDADGTRGAASGRDDDPAEDGGDAGAHGGGSQDSGALRHRSARPGSLDRGGYVDAQSGAVLSVEQGDDTFRGLVRAEEVVGDSGERSPSGAGAGTENTSESTGESAGREEQEPVGAVG